MVTFDQTVWKCSLGLWNTNANCAALRDGVILPLGGESAGAAERRRPDRRQRRHRNRDDHGAMAGSQPAESDVDFDRQPGMTRT